MPELNRCSYCDQPIQHDQDYVSSNRRSVWGLPSHTAHLE